ncbi:MAG: DUF4133 domain-containing protein [Bacteroides cellulosilyticus]|nr:DUF4133 domain-containing protein [Bacteroides cellulosilyticus]
MAEYPINKGVDSKVEFQGLTSQYLFLFVGGLGGVFLAFVILLAGVPQVACILFALMAGGLLIWATFSLNRRYGPNGLMKLMASQQHPRRIIHRRNVRYLLNFKKRSLCAEH